MLKDENFDAPDADIILRALGPPKRDFRVHKLLLSLASPVFKDMFSLPQPTSGDSRESTAVAEVEIVEVTDPADALDIVLRIIYPFDPPSLDGNINTIVECLVIVDKYNIQGAKSQLCSALTQMGATEPLRVYAAASRFGFADLMDSTSGRILSSVHLAGIPELPDDFNFISATAYHKLVRQRAIYLEMVVVVIERTPLKSWCSDCPGTKFTAEEVSRLRLAHLIITGTPVDVDACCRAWVEAYGRNSGCKESCIQKFIRFSISKVHKCFSAWEVVLKKAAA